MLTSAQFCLFHLWKFSSIWLKHSSYSLYKVYYIWQTGMHGFCLVHSEFHGCCYSVLPGSNKVALATLYVLWCYVICYYSSLICAFQFSNKLVLVTSFVLWCRQKEVICYLFQECKLRCYQSRVIFAVILLKQRYLL